MVEIMPPTRGAAVTPDANKALLRRLFEDVLPAGDPAAARELVTPDFVDHDPLPGQPPGADAIEFVVSTLHGSWRDPRFTVHDLLAEGDRVVIRWTLRGTNIGPMFGRPPTGEPAEQTAIIIFRIEDGRLAERWGAFSPPGSAGRDAGVT